MLAPNQFGPLAGQAEVPVGRQPFECIKVGLRGRGAAHLEDRGALVDLVEHGDVSHVNAEVGRGGELAPEELAAPAGDGGALRSFALEVRPGEARIDYWKVRHARRL